MNNIHQLLIDAGEALYGSRWQSELARDLEVSVRTMQRWVSGEQPVPRGVPTDLMRLLAERAEAMDDLIERCKYVV